MDWGESSLAVVVAVIAVYVFGLYRFIANVQLFVTYYLYRTDSNLKLTIVVDILIQTQPKNP